MFSKYTENPSSPFFDFDLAGLVEVPSTIDLLKSDSSFFIDEFQFDPELADLEIINGILFETSTPTNLNHPKNNFNLNEAEQEEENGQINNCLFEFNESYGFLDNSFTNNLNKLIYSASETTNTNIKCVNSLKLKLNDFVCINHKKFGLLKFQGRVHFADGIFCGIELEDCEGKHDGKIDNIR